MVRRQATISNWLDLSQPRQNQGGDSTTTQHQNNINNNNTTQHNMNTQNETTTNEQNQLENTMPIIGEIVRTHQNATNVGQINDGIFPFPPLNAATNERDRNSMVHNQYRNQLTQMSIRNSTSPILNNMKSWGDSLETKSHEHIRVAFRNINSLPPISTHVKNKEMIKDLYDAKIDIFGCSEVNLNWRVLPYQDRPHERFRGIFESFKLSWSHNEDPEFDDRYQIGGTLMIANHPIGHRVSKTGNDKDKLGRWSWMLMQGRQGIKVRIVTVYRPVQSLGPTSAYQQQQKQLLSKNIDTNPRTQLLDDLSVDLQEWTAQGDKLIVMGDFNEDVRGQTIQSWFQQFQMTEAILVKHGNNAPNTFRGGVVPIDGIFTNITIQAVRGGYSACNWGMSTDHRLIWIDLETDTIFGNSNQFEGRPSARRLKCDDPRLVKKFNELRLKHIIEHEVEYKLESLLLNLNANGFTEQIMQQVEEIDNLRVQGILLADRKCRKLKMGHVYWSPALQDSIAKIRYLRECKKFYETNEYYRNGQRKQYKVNSRTLYKLFKKTTFETRATEAVVVKEWLTAEYQIYNQIKIDSEKHRNNYIEQLAQAQAENNHQDVATILQQLIMREQQRALSRKIKVLKGTFRSGVTSIEAPNDAGEWTVVSDKLLIEQGCMAENIRRFTKANHTPALTEDQVQLLGWTADSEYSRNILQTGISPPQLHEEIKIMVPFLQTPDTIAMQGLVDATINEEDFISGWKKTKEFTATGKSGVHFGHFKASIQNQTIMDIDRKLAEVSLKYGYSLTRWQQGTDIMIPKKSDSIRVDRLRTIVLFEADFNFVNKIIGKRLMNNAEQAKSLAPEQYGSRKKKSSIVHATNKVLLFDITRQRKQDAALLVLDAESCYDRIAPPIAALAMKRQGAPDSFTGMLFNTLDKMKHYIRTAYGESVQCYYRQEEKFHGILQGNGAGPAIWAMVSSPILDYLRAQHLGVTIRRPSSGEIIKVPAFAFVDDTDLVQEILERNQIAELPAQALKAWELGLRVTGGALVPGKCNWYAMVHKWTGDHWLLEKTIDTPGSIYLQHESGEDVEITRLEPDKAVLALGVMFAPNGSMHEEMVYLKNKGQIWAEQVRSSGITRNEAWYLLNSVVMKTIEYPLLSTTLSRSQLDEVMVPILKVGLTRSGICRNMNREIVYSKNKYFGLGIRHPYVTQGLRKLMMFLNGEHTPISDHLLKTAWEVTSFESGYGNQFLQLSDKNVGKCITRTWMSTLWEFLSYYQITLTNQLEPNPFRYSQDFFLMQKATTVLKGIELKWFNYCRIYLGVTLCSDITTIDGKKIRAGIWAGKLHSSTMPHVMGIRQPRPSERIWTKWRHILRQLLDADEYGRILMPHMTLRFGKWRWFWCNRTGKIFDLQDKDEVYEMTQILPEGQRSSRRALRFGSRLQCNFEVPLDLKAITVIFEGDECIIESTQTHEVTIIEEVPLSLQDKFEIVEFGNTILLKEAFIQGTLIAVSDGSTKQGIGAAAWILTTVALANMVWIQGVVQTPGHARFQDSHRSESVGILGSVVSLCNLITTWGCNTGGITIICDNLTALTSACDTRKYPMISVEQSDFDVLRSIRKHMLPSVTYKWKHVYGHRDNVLGYVLSTEEKLNVKMDLVAKHARERYEQDPSLQEWDIRLPKEDWALLVNGGKITKNVGAEITDYIDKTTMTTFWNKKKRIAHQHFGDIEWDAIALAMKKLPQDKRIWIVKHVAGICGVNSTMVKWRQKTSPDCKRCSEYEDSAHVWKCQDETAILLWQDSMDELKVWLLAQKTDPIMVQKMITGLTNWRNACNQTRAEPEDTVLTQQTLLGWDFVFEGCWGTEWTKKQEVHFKVKGSKKTGLKWLASVIQKVWMIAWKLWELRNEAEHLQDLQDATILADQEILILIQVGMESQDRIVLQMIQENLITGVQSGTLPIKKAWIRNFKAAHARSLRRPEELQGIEQMRRDMARYLGQNRR